MNRGWFIKNATGILWYSSNKIAHRVKTQARSQNNRSRALKWGIVCLYSSSSFGDTTKYMKIWVLQFFHFCKKVAKSLCKITKLRKLRKMTLFVFNHIFKSIWATETYNTSFESSWPFVLTSSLSFDSRTNHFWAMLQNTSRILYESPSIVYVAVELPLKNEGLLKRKYIGIAKNCNVVSHILVKR